jgi:hypothetical protein
MAEKNSNRGELASLISNPELASASLAQQLLKAITARFWRPCNDRQPFTSPQMYIHAEGSTA